MPGLYFYRDATHVDGLYAKDGVLYFAPNKELSNGSYTSHIVLTSNNYNGYAPTKTGTGASGTWGISISGNATTASKITTDAGSATRPVYFYGGVPVICSGTLAVGITGNAATATKLATTVAINGTTFDGSAAITTASWGTARTITIGNSGKSVNGSTNVSWTLSEIGALAVNGNAVSATKAIQDGNGAVISSTYAKLSGPVFTGTAMFNEKDGACINFIKEFYIN